MVAEVTKLRERAAFTDIPAMMRAMANDIEQGRIKADAAFLVTNEIGEVPQVFGWGRIDDPHLGAIEVLTAGVHQLLTNRVARK